MTTFFLVLLALHVVHSVWVNRSEPDGRSVVRATIVLVTQLPMFLIALYFGLQTGAVSRDLLSPWYIALGVLGGHIVFCTSLFITPLTFGPRDHGIPRSQHIRSSLRESLAAVRPHVFDFAAPVRFVIEAPVVLTRFITVSVSEELIWRAATQVMLITLIGNAPVAIVITAVAFALVHRHFFENEFIVSFEFLLFSLFLGIAFQVTASLIFVIAIHAVRDIEIVYHEFCEKVEELGSEEAAYRAIEAMYSRRSPLAA